MSEVRPGTPGYRGALPPKRDHLARPWVLLVVIIFLLMFVLAALNVPSVLFPEPTPIPVPSLSPGASPSGSPAESASGSPSASPSASPSTPGSPSPTP